MLFDKRGNRCVFPRHIIDMALELLPEIKQTLQSHGLDPALGATWASGVPRFSRNAESWRTFGKRFHEIVPIADVMTVSDSFPSYAPHPALQRGRHPRVAACNSSGLFAPTREYVWGDELGMPRGCEVT